MKRPADPNELRKLPRLLRAVTWRLPLEYGQFMGKLTYKSIGDCLDKNKLAEFIPERGGTMEETSVTKGQQELLLRAQARTAKMPEAIAEIGAWRGITTVALAERTTKRVYAVDPHKKDEFPGINEAFEAFSKRTSGFANIVHVRHTSGEAARELSKMPLSLVFVDAMHDYINTWFDFWAWSEMLVPGGIIVLHDVDDHVGTNLACRKIFRLKNYRPWGYCPNIVAFEKTA